MSVLTRRRSTENCTEMQIDLVKILRLLACAFAVLLLSWVLRGCKTCECLPSVEYRDSIVTRYQHDTIQTYEKDSIYIYAKGDTVWRERWSIRWRDKIVERHDTIYCDQEKETVRVEEVTPALYKNCTRGFFALLSVIVLYIAIRILIRVYLKK